ncbi:MAG TPA: hypothetical protein VHH91_07725, partial [Vicinamibacterales bacterium]|nr:hypothetical protein [Vicinamibacterales bacterium]
MSFPALHRIRLTLASVALAAAVAVTVPGALVDAARIPQPAPAARDSVPRAEHPRPDFMRSDWLTLNGRWEFE